LKNTPSSSSRDKLAISRIPLSFNDKSSPAISHNLVSSSLYFKEFLREDEDYYGHKLDLLPF